MRLILVLTFLTSALCSAEYYSQHGQDRFVHETFFKDIKDGFFIEIGAFDGVFLSNTYFFEKELGWSGICIEPIPELFEKLEKNRNCFCLCGCIATEHNVSKDFLNISGSLQGLSGIVDKYNPKHKERIKNEVAVQGNACEVIPVKCYNLNRVLEEMKVDHVHLLSLDTEGGEFEILQNFDFSKCRVDVIVVEDNYGDKPFVQLLKKNGFSLFKKVEQDLIFLNGEFNAN